VQDLGDTIAMARMMMMDADATALRKQLIFYLMISLV
jgi:hypothetical protein